MTMLLSVYTAAGTLLGTFEPLQAQYDHRQAEDGVGTTTVAGDAAAALLAEQVIVRVSDGTADRFAFVPTTKIRREAAKTSEVDLEGPGVRWLLHAGQLYQEDTTACALPADERWFGWMSSDYDDTGWSVPASHGMWIEQPFATVRPENWPAPFAEYIWLSTDTDLDEEDGLFRQTFDLSEDTDVVLCITADDEYECWLDGTKLQIGQYGSDTKYAWKGFDEVPLRLCAGTHTFAVRGRNLDIPPPNPAWVLWAFCETAGDGKPAAANQQSHIYHDHTAGTWSWTSVMSPYDGTVTVDFDALASDVQTELETLYGAGNVEVSGGGDAGDPFVVEFVGALANRIVPYTTSGSGLSGGTVFADSIVQKGSAAATYAYSTPDTVWAYDPASGEPGMTPGHILKVACDEVRSRGLSVFDDIADGYSATVDSKGDPWTFELNLPVSLPADVHRLAVLIEEQGIDVWMDPDLTLQAANEQGVDDTVTVTLAVGAGKVTDVEARQEESTVRNVVRVRTTKRWATRKDDESITARGRWESGIILEGFDTVAAAEPHTDLLLNDLKSPQRKTTVTIPAEGGQVPYVDFGLGDRVSAPAFGTSGFESVAMRVIGITGRMVGRSIDWSIELVD